MKNVLGSFYSDARRWQYSWDHSVPCVYRQTLPKGFWSNVGSLPSQQHERQRLHHSTRSGQCLQDYAAITLSSLFTIPLTWRKCRKAWFIKMLKHSKNFFFNVCNFFKLKSYNDNYSCFNYNPFPGCLVICLTSSDHKQWKLPFPQKVQKHGTISEGLSRQLEREASAVWGLPWELGSGNVSLATKCITVVLPKGSFNAMGKTEDSLLHIYWPTEITNQNWNHLKNWSLFAGPTQQTELLTS